MNPVHVSQEWCERYKAAVENGEDRQDMFDELFSQFKVNYTHNIDYEAMKKEMLELIEEDAAPLAMHSVSIELTHDFIENILKRTDPSKMQRIAMYCFYQLLCHTVKKEEE